MRTIKQGVKLAICAWCDANALDVADGEIVDLVRRLQSLDIMDGSDADGIERMTTDLIHLLADRIDDEPMKAMRLRKLAAHISDTLVAVGLTADVRCIMPDRERREPDSTIGITEREEAGDDGAPGTAVGEEGCRPLRYDLIYRMPVRVTLHGKRLLALHPPFDGRVRLRPECGETRATVVPLDELAPSDRARLKAPIRRRQELLVRCANRRCGSVFRAWLADGDELSIQETGGRFITDVHGVFMARCEKHRLTP